MQPGGGSYGSRSLLLPGVDRPPAAPLLSLRHLRHSPQPMHAGDDAAKVKWMTVDKNDDDFLGLYASHREWVEAVDLELRQKRSAAKATQKV